MTAEPVPLATQLADLRAAAEAHEGRCWLTRALEAMIMAALARIFGRLEELVRLWQAGLLPALPALPAPNTPRHPTHLPSNRAPDPASASAAPRCVHRGPREHATSPRETTRPTHHEVTHAGRAGAAIAPVPARHPRARPYRLRHIKPVRLAIHTTLASRFKPEIFSECAWGGRAIASYLLRYQKIPTSIKPWPATAVPHFTSLAFIATVRSSIRGV